MLATGRQNRQPQPDWFELRRAGALTLEDDPEKYDPAFWIDVFRRTKSNAVCLSAGGYIAYYPSEVPLHYVSRIIGDKDPFGQLVRRRPGARHARHGAGRSPRYPRRRRRGPSGMGRVCRRHASDAAWAYPDVWVTNAYGDYNSGFMPEVVKEIVRKYDIDAIFANRWQGHGVDYCDDSAAASAGHVRPRPADEARCRRPGLAGLAQWRRRRAHRLIAQWDER